MQGPWHPHPGDSFDSISAAAFAGEPQAQFRMGEIHRRGLLGMPVDESQARRWYEKAAEAGHGTAIFLLNNWRNRDHFV